MFNLSKPSLYDIGSGWVFSIPVKDNLQDIIEIVSKSKLNAILISDLFDLPFSIGEMTIILYRVYSRSAYDLYHKLHGMHIRTIDPIIVQSLLCSCGVKNDKFLILSRNYNIV